MWDVTWRLNPCKNSLILYPRTYFNGNMSESTSCSTKETKDPVEDDEPKASGSHDDGKKTRTSSRKRKASTSEPVGMADEVKAKLKVKLSSSKSSKKKKSKKSTKEKKSGKAKSSKKKGSSKKASTEAPVEVPQDASVEVRNELPTAENLISTTAEVHNEMQSTEILTYATVESCNADVPQSGSSFIYQAQEPLQSVNGEDDKEQDQDSERESCSVALVLTDGESESSRSNFGKNTNDTQYSRSDELLLGFSSNFEPALTIAVAGTKEVREDQDEAMDVCDNASNSTEADSDNDRTMIEAEDTVMDEVLLGFNSKQELQLAKETTNANPVSLNQQNNVEVRDDLHEAMDTCEDFHKYKKADLSKENGEASENEEIDVCGDVDVEETHHAMEFVETNLESQNKHADQEVSEEQNNIVDLSKHEKNQESESTKGKSSKSKSSKSSKSSSSKSSKPSVSKSSKPSSSKSRKSSPSKASSSRKKETKKDHSKDKRKKISKQDFTTATTSPDPLYKLNKQDDITCRICEQTINSQLKFYNGEPENGYDEELAIIDSRLLLFNGDEENISREDTRAYNKITSFR